MDDIFLPKVSLKQIIEINELFSGSACATFALEQNEYAMVFEPTNIVQSWWCSIQATIGADDVEIFLDTPPPLHSILPGVWPEESSSLPETVILIALNALLENILDELGENLGVAVALKGITLQPKQKKVIKEGLFFSIVELESSSRTICALTFISGIFPEGFTSRLAKIIKSSIEDSSGSYTPPIACDLVVGYTELSYRNIEDIEIHDIVFVEEYYPITHTIVVRTPEQLLYRGKWDNGTVTIEEEIPNEYLKELDMKEESRKNIPIRITMDIGSVLIPMGEINTLQNGYVFTTEQNTSAPVILRMHGRKFAIGELLDVEGKIGVRIVDIVMQKNEDILGEMPLHDTENQEYYE